ncbi:MAG: CDP-diacylglycerol diphosphatase, partial [Pseudolabrys sp.]
MLVGYTTEMCSPAFCMTTGVNSFQLLADDLPAGDSMGAQSLVVVGDNDADGRPGFVLLAGRADVT